MGLVEAAKKEVGEPSIWAPGRTKGQIQNPPRDLHQKGFPLLTSLQSPSSYVDSHPLAPALLKPMPQTTGVTTYSLETKFSLPISKHLRRGKEEAEKIGEGIYSWYPLGNSEHIFLKEHCYSWYLCQLIPLHGGT